MNTFNQETFSLLQSLDSSEFDALFASAKSTSVLKSKYIFKEGEFSSNIYFVLSGQVKIGSTTNTGNFILKDVINAGGIFGEQVLTNNKSRKEFAQAMTHGVKVVAVNKNDFLNLMKVNNQFANDIVQYRVQKLKTLEQRIENFIFKKAKARISNFLSKMATDKGIQIGIDERLINLGMSHKEIALITDTSRQTVARVLGELKGNNYIHFSARKPSKILVRNISALQAL